MKQYWWIVVIVAVGAAIFLINGSRNNAADCRDFSHGTVTIAGKVWRVAVARTAAEKSLGLGGCEHLPELTGMYFPFEAKQTPTFWMKGMVMPIDIVWIADGRVVGVEANVPVGDTDQLPLYQPDEPVDGVLEIGAGEAARAGIKMGDVVQVQI